MKNEQYIKEQYNWQDLQDIIHVLRQPDGCPWDSVQTYESLKKCVINEANEVVEAVDNDDFVNLKEELGDLLMLVVSYSEIAKERGEFTIDEVINDAAQKMVRRHPNVFDNGCDSDSKEYYSDNIRCWNQIKLQEKKERLKEYETLYHQGKISLDLLKLQEKKLEQYENGNDSIRLGIITKK